MTPEDSRRFPGQPVTLKTGDAAVIRPLSPEDGEALADFYADIPRADFRFYCPHPLDRKHAFLNASRAHSPHEVVLVMEQPKGRIRGYAWYRWDSDGAERSTFGICLRPDAKGAGAGRLLMTRLLEIARHIGPPVMGLTVQLANAHAVSLYQSMGFSVVRRQMRVADPAFHFPDEPEYGMEQRFPREPSPR